MSMSTLYQNAEWTVMLLDLPASIEESQCRRILCSVPAIGTPYPSTEPKGAKRQAALASIGEEERNRHRILQDLVSSALNEIRVSRAGSNHSWCHSRQVALEESAPQDGDETDSLEHPDGVPSSLVPIILSFTQPGNSFHRVDGLRDALVINPRNDASELEVCGLGSFYIPPKAVFILSTLERGLPSFSWALDNNLSIVRNGFDLVLMDPPWSNRSVRHAGTYRTTEDQPSNVFQQAMSIVESGITPSGVVAVWITNKEAIRHSAIDGLARLQFYLVEEWVWIKITSQGEPVTALDGVWRRPYEVLLLFRKDAARAIAVQRRVIAAVPDVHSRKPSLKQLFDRLLPAGYTALELFARSLTAGWCSWGDEVLKFQHSSQWRSIGTHQDKGSATNST